MLLDSLSLQFTCSIQLSKFEYAQQTSLKIVKQTVDLKQGANLQDLLSSSC